jgi:non-ribosomal peptide synthetase component E (peptide arylation enzyme)
MVGVNIGSLLTSSAASYPKSPAIVHGSLTMDYEQFNARVNRLSNTVQTFCSSTNW